MSGKLIVRGGKSLRGEIHISAAKNAVLPLIACCIASEKEIRIKNCPRIADIISMTEIIKEIGGYAEFDGDTLAVCCKDVSPRLVSAELTGGIRSSVFILGPILARFKRANISYPGGCEIGLRPIDLHIYGLKCLGVKVTEDGGTIACDGSAMTGGTVDLDFPSVGATENLMMAGLLGSGVTVIRNAAREPEIVDLQNFINFLGGKAYGAGTGTVTVEGVDRLGSGGDYTPIGDRIAAATYLSAVAQTGGSVRVVGVEPELMHSVLRKLCRVGCSVEEFDKAVILSSDGKLRSLHKIETQPYPGFPTDMQPQITAMLTTALGTSFIVENLFESRYNYTAQLVKMGANIIVSGRVAVVKGVKALHSAFVKAEDLRGGAALLSAALATHGETVIDGVHHIDRGYYKIEDVYASLGAEVYRTQ